MPRIRFYASDEALKIIERSSKSTLGDLYRILRGDYEYSPYMVHLQIKKIDRTNVVFLLYNESMKRDVWYIGYYDPDTLERRNALERLTIGGEHGTI